jgi:hypothetical protein
MSAITSSGVCPVGAGESKVYVPCMLLQIYDNNNPNETLAAEWDNLPEECHKGLKAMYGNAPRKSMLANLNRVVALMNKLKRQLMLTASLPRFLQQSP